MELNELLEGHSLTGRQAAIIFFAFLSLIILAALLLVIFSDFFRNLFAWTGTGTSFGPDVPIQSVALAAVAALPF